MDTLESLMGRKPTALERRRAEEMMVFMLDSEDYVFENYIKDELSKEEFDEVVDVLTKLGCKYLLKSFLANKL